MQIFCALMLLGCSHGATAAGGNKFNPYMQSRLPAGSMQAEAESMLKEMGARAPSLQDEVQHRPRWKEEVYPVVFGDRKAGNEILVFLDYAAPQSEALWQEVVKASQSLDPRSTKIAVLSRNSEKYGTELMGGGIWMAFMRPQAAMHYYSYSLNRWNTVKNQQAQKGGKRVFTYEYDAVLNATDQPILYAYLHQVQPPVPGKEHVEIVRYAYDAGNVNLFQAVTAANAYGVKQFPAVVVNDKLLGQANAQSIVAAVKK